MVLFAQVCIRYGLRILFMNIANITAEDSSLFVDLPANLVRKSLLRNFVVNENAYLIFAYRASLHKPYILKCLVLYIYCLWYLLVIIFLEVFSDSCSKGLWVDRLDVSLWVGLELF